MGQSTVTVGNSDTVNLLVKGSGDVFQGSSVTGNGLFSRVGTLEGISSATSLLDPAGNTRVSVLNSGVNLKSDSGTTRISYNEGTTSSFSLDSTSLSVFTPSGTTAFSVTANEANDANVSADFRCGMHLHETLRVDGNTTVNGDVEVDTSKDFKKEGVSYSAFAKLADLETRLAALETPIYTFTSSAVTFQPKSSGFDSNSLLFDSSTLWSKNGASGAVIPTSDDNFFQLKLIGPTTSSGGGAWFIRVFVSAFVIQRETNDTDSIPTVNLPLVFYSHQFRHSEPPTITWVPKPSSAGWEVHYHQGGLNSAYTPDTAEFSMELAQIR